MIHERLKRICIHGTIDCYIPIDTYIAIDWVLIFPYEYYYEYRICSIFKKKIGNLSILCSIILAVRNRTQKYVSLYNDFKMEFSFLILLNN